ncbi:glycoside hydrolase [Mucilaginibacter sp. PPCGB 2223]|uniref:malectin domain-containing carbohydrate-binding protein n=1 Tax=Mucilaginibacter sp. PPCGB 2223 TaxID=1886027 RepID=UPI000825A8A1|nr:malectin domain-containing carbohydrate-binding protein [Mucilaginibacter sp. PPCGB 2223]OCX53036.1 glycoside hydrolase [Mucilaginibacter sp. PPCGB 2223]
MQIAILLLLIQPLFAQSVRQDISLNKNWLTAEDDNNVKAYGGFENPNFKTINWKSVDVPHNWDEYEGYRRLKHGDRHGYAWYRKSFAVKIIPGKRYSLYFEGVGSYATVWLNGKQVGYHAGGRTTFTLDVTDAIKAQNILAVRADHPDHIQDLPWVCGGSSDEVGFSEGSQPIGIFRPVHLVVTNAVRVQPFGVHIWNDTTVSERSATVNIETEVKNYKNSAASITISNKLIDKEGKIVAKAYTDLTLNRGESTTTQYGIGFKNVHLWSLQDPYLYRLVTEVLDENKNVIDRETTPYGIRRISWPVGRKDNQKQFLLNGKPVFINGIGEYEHNMGQSHAFTDEQVRARVMQVKAAGFNAFRDAHQPHNLLYQKYWDELGVLWWPQFTAHIWYDTPAFRDNFKTLLIDWVKERRNDPSNILWGLQNESKLPADFARECSDIIRKLDPTASSQRKITTCNGGEGTDWNVPQNWTGTYGGDPQTYAADIQKQILIGEYGAWRSIDMHTEGAFVQDGPLSENREEQLLETKIRLAESVKDKSAGQFLWVLSSHDNPGRVQAGEGYRELDRIGPINYKGLLTPWGEPTDAFYLYRANYVPKDKEPMVYIVSHTWPDRWLKPGKKDSIIVYSNCDEVELFNDINGASLGKRRQQGKGTHFQWDGVDIKCNMLYAVGYVSGKKVAEDYIMLHHLPASPNFKNIRIDQDILAPAQGMNYVYRVNCGGPAYTDHLGNTWMQDVQQPDKKHWGSTSWTDDFAGMPAMFGSQRRIIDPVAGTLDEPLFQTFRYGRNKLKYDFPLPNGEYRVELYFAEPWYGLANIDATGWRVFDVAVNGKTMLKNVDLFKEAGFSTAVKKVLYVHVTNGWLSISFPQVASGQAVISAIAIATKNTRMPAVTTAPTLVQNLRSKGKDKWKLNTWMDTGNQQYAGAGTQFSKLPPNLYGAEWLSTSQSATGGASFSVATDAEVYVAIDEKAKQLPGWLKNYDDTKTFIETDADGGHRFNVYHHRFNKNATVIFGKNADNALMYTISVLPVTYMERATDLKPTVSYKPETAILTGGITLAEPAGKKAISFKSDEGSIAWAIAPGVADVYTIRVKYLNTTGKTLSANVKVLAADGPVMKSGIMEFPPTTADKWKTVETTTGTSINAGNYRVQISAKAATGLSISGIEIQ